MEPEEGCAHPALGEDGLEHAEAHDELKVRAAVVIELGVELPVGGGGEEGKSNKAMPGRSGPSHSDLAQ